jgi:hypothetical protein
LVDFKNRPGVDQETGSEASDDVALPQGVAHASSGTRARVSGSRPGTIAGARCERKLSARRGNPDRPRGVSFLAASPVSPGEPEQIRLFAPAGFGRDDWSRSRPPPYRLFSAAMVVDPDRAPER